MVPYISDRKKNRLHFVPQAFEAKVIVEFNAIHNITTCTLWGVHHKNM